VAGEMVSIVLLALAATGATVFRQGNP